jgi:hypothetical protein
LRSDVCPRTGRLAEEFALGSLSLAAPVASLPLSLLSFLALPRRSRSVGGRASLGLSVGLTDDLPSAGVRSPNSGSRNLASRGVQTEGSRAGHEAKYRALVDFTLRVIKNARPRTKLNLFAGVGKSSVVCRSQRRSRATLLTVGA